MKLVNKIKTPIKTQIKDLFLQKIYNEGGLKDFIKNSKACEIFFENENSKFQILDFERGFEFIIQNKHIYAKIIFLYDCSIVELYQYKGELSDIFQILKDLEKNIKENKKSFNKKFAFIYGRQKKYFIY
jgi:hypothetical protein